MHLKFTELKLKKDVSWDTAFLEITEIMKDFFEEFKCDWSKNKKTR